MDGPHNFKELLKPVSDQIGSRSKLCIRPLSVLTKMEEQTCCHGDHVNEGVDRLHQVRLLPLQHRVVAAGESQLQLQRLDGRHLIPDHRLETNSHITPER